MSERPRPDIDTVRETLKEEEQEIEEAVDDEDGSAEPSSDD